MFIINAFSVFRKASHPVSVLDELPAPAELPTGYVGRSHKASNIACECGNFMVDKRTTNP